MITLLVSLALQAHAAPVAQSVGHSSDEFVKVTSMVQFVEGHAQKTETSGMKSDLVYQSPMYEGDRVETNGVLKVATRSNCIFVLRGDGTLAAPSGAKPWRMRAESLRLICSSRTTAETFGIENQPLVMTNGEVLFSGKNILLVNGAATYSGKPLPLHKLVSMDVSEVSSQPSENELRALNLAQKPPSEAYVWPAPAEASKPDKIYTSRLMFGPVLGNNAVRFDVNDYNQDRLNDGGGARLQMQFKNDDGSAFMVALNYRTAEISDNNKNNSYIQMSPNRSNIDLAMLELGHRNSFDRWWSPYWRLGAGYTNAKVYYSATGPFGNYVGSAYRYPFYALNATYGLDLQITPHFLRPVAFYAGAEASIVQSIWRGGRINEGNGYGNSVDAGEPWRMTLLSALITFGVEVQF